MEFIISEKAVELYKNEMNLKAGDSIRLYVRVGGVGSGGFSVGVTKDEPSKNSFVTTVTGVNFFIEEGDFWYLNGMTIDFNEDLNYLTFENPNITDVVNPN